MKNLPLRYKKTLTVSLNLCVRGDRYIFGGVFPFLTHGHLGVSGTSLWRTEDPWKITKKRYVVTALSSRLLRTISHRMFHGTCSCFHPFSMPILGSPTNITRGGTSQCSMGGGSSELPPTSPGYTESHLFIHEFMNCPLNLRDNRHTYSDLLDVSSHEHTNYVVPSRCDISVDIPDNLHQLDHHDLRPRPGSLMDP